MTKRITSLLLAAVLLIGLIPMSAFTVSAAGSPVVNIPNTSGTGLSSDDPIIVDAFAELKAAMEYDGTAYVRLKSSGTSFAERLPAPSSSSQNAITMVGTKYLELDGFASYDSVEDVKYNAFMLVSGKLTISGEGGITYKHNSRFGDGAVLLMKDADASLTVKDTPKITGELNDQRYDSEHWAFARAIAATGGKLTINGGTFYGRVFDGPGVQSYQHRSAVYLGRAVKATVNGGEFRCVRSYSTTSPMDSHPVGITLAPDATKNILLCGGTYHGMYITGTEKALNEFLLQGYYFYDLDTNARFIGDKKESPYDDYENATDRYHRITLIDVAEGVLNFGVMNPVPTSAEMAAHKTDLGTLQIGTNQINKTFSATAARLPDRESAAGFTPRLLTDVYKDGEVIYSAENGNAINLNTFVDSYDDIGDYKVVYTLGMWDVLTETSRWSITHTYTMRVVNPPITFVRATVKEPVIGETASEAALLTDHISRFNATWYKSENGINFRGMQDDEIFQSNYTYQLLITATADEYYAFADNVTATVNNRSAVIEKYPNEDASKRLHFIYKFPMGDGALNSITVTTPPAKTTYKEGDSLQPDGMVVTGNFGTGVTRELALGTEYRIVELGGVKEDQTYFTVEATINGVTKTATCPITVTPANYAFTFLEEAPLTFDLPFGATPTAKTLTVQNIGDQKLGASDITLTGANPEAFVLSRDQLWGLFTTGTNSQRDFTVAPAEDLAVGVYTATLTVTNTNADISISMELVLNVYSPVTISGTVTSYGNESDIVTIGLYKEGDFAYTYQDLPIGNNVTFAFENIVPAEYVLEVIKKGHKPYKLSLGNVTESLTVDVELEPTVPVSVIELEMYGYKLAAPLSALGVHTETDGVAVGGYLITDSLNTVVNNSFAAADTDYFITVLLNPADGFNFDELMIMECTLNGETSVNSEINSEGLWLMFALPKLEAVTIEEINLSTDPYAVGDDFDMLTVFSNTEGVSAVDVHVIDDQMSILEGVFEYNTPYLFEVVFVVAGGSEINFTDTDLITLDGISAMELYDVGEGVYVAIFLMPELKVQHEVTFVIGDSPVATQPVNEGEAAKEPEEPYLDGYKFMGWYDENGDLYDFTMPVTAPITLKAKFTEAYVVTLCFGDSPVGWITVEAGELLEKPEDPGMEGKIFVGWCTADGELYDFSQPVYSDIFLYAKFEDDPNAILKGDINGDGAVDIKDAMAAFYHVNEYRYLDADEEDRADVNGDGGVDIKDAMRIFYYVNEYIDEI